MSKSNQKVTKKEKDEFFKGKIPVTFNEEQIKLINSYTGILGNTKAEIVRNIVINWILNNGGKQ
ncbi:MAG: hypothetical protein AABW89_04310 [Nanoarchaeota archaeon]